MNSNLLIKKEKLYSLIWVLPVVALIITGTLIYKNNFNKGPVITLTLSKADGLEEGKTAIKALSVDVGKITKISLSDDLKSVEATVQMNPNTEKLLRQDSLFWIQKPRIDKQGVSGLNTLLSGYYIELSPGSSNEFRKSFNVLDDPPVRTDASGMLITLSSKSSKKVSEGDAITFKGLEVGRVVSQKYDFSKGLIEYRVFIEYPYANLIYSTTKFWVSSGISVGFSADGVTIDTDSMESLLKGGISFDNPEGVSFGDKVVSGEQFELYDNKNAVMLSFDDSLNYVVLLKDYYRGLVEDAPVFYRGVQVGVVRKSPYFSQGFELFKDSSAAPAVLISIQKDRFDKTQKRSLEELKRNIDDLLSRGLLSASLETMNILTGKNCITLKDVKIKTGKTPSPANYDGYTVIPLNENDSGNSLQQDLGVFAHNLSKLPLESLSNNVNAMLKDSTKTVGEIGKLCDSLNEIVNQLKTQGISKQTLETLNSINQSLKAYGKDSGFYLELNEVSRSLNETLKSLKPIMQQLDEQSNSLIFKYQKSDPIPKAAKSR